MKIKWTEDRFKITKELFERSHHDFLRSGLSLKQKDSKSNDLNEFYQSANRAVEEEPMSSVTIPVIKTEKSHSTVTILTSSPDTLQKNSNKLFETLEREKEMAEERKTPESEN